MTEEKSAYDVCIVGGAGHVGAPLAVVMATRGNLRALIHDVNRPAMDKLASGELPFIEDGGEFLLRRALSAGMLGFSADPSCIRGVPYVVITVGTPIDEFNNPVLRLITDCIQRLLPYLSDSQTIVLRSTVFPGVTESLARFLQSHGKETKIAFCPERVVQGQAIREITVLPQIVSGTTPEAEESAVRLFSRIAPTIVRMVPQEAEFAKLICNAYRYVQFAAANQFYMMAQAAGLDYQRVLDGLKQDYPRAATLPGPGFAAGPCLMKDTMQLFAFSNNRFMLGQVAMMVNEGLPNFLVENLRARYDLTQTRVGILGMAFKSDIDDTRQSLSYKLGKILRFHGARVLYSDEFARDPTFVSKEELVHGSDVIIVGVPHSAYRELAIPDGVQVIDLWRVVPTRGAAQMPLRMAS
jgi:UDP-N-acetyl-D-mannosaminuronic acid dehydrogenase